MNSSFKLILQDGFGEMLCCSQWGSFTQTWKCLLLGSWKKSRQKIKIHCVLKTSHQGLSKACLILISNIKLQLNILYCAQVYHQKGRTSEMGNISDRKFSHWENYRQGKYLLSKNGWNVLSFTLTLTAQWVSVEGGVISKGLLVSC